MNEQRFYGHGKLLLTGEYFVLDGADAFAIPTRFGQVMRIRELSSTDDTLYWVALNSKEQVWLNLAFDKVTFECLNEKSAEAERLTAMLTEARKLNPLFLTEGRDLAIETRLEFPNNWGLGSSSTLVHCLAQWAGVNGYELLKATIGGSGYDVACAASDVPLLYRLQNGEPQTIKTEWWPSFAEHIYFAHLGRKQLSTEGIKHYRSLLTDKTHTINELNYVTEAIIKCSLLQEFERLISEHERIVGSELKMLQIKEEHFQDYWGSVKSLGAWGGDFVMLTCNRARNELTTYLREKNIETIFRFDEMIYSPGAGSATD